MSASTQYVPSPTPDLARIQRALISVSDKEGLVELGKALAAHGVEILSTGGSAKSLRDAGLKVVEVSDHTGFPEIMDGRVKTLQPSIHGGILARRTDAGHQKAMSDHKIAGIDLVVVNLYPFEATVARGADFPTCVENIDIGGPALIRASAKNHDFVTIVVDPKDYASVLQEFDANKGATTLALRRKLADLGIDVAEKTNRHWKVRYYGDPRYSGVIPCSGSDGFRGGRNLAADLIKRFF